MERRRWGVGVGDCGCLQFLLKQAGQKGGDAVLETRPCTTLMEDGKAGGGQRSKLEVHTERRGPPVEWKMEEGGREGEGGGWRERKAGWRGQGESVRERGRAGWGLRLPLLTAIDFL